MLRALKFRRRVLALAMAGILVIPSESYAVSKDFRAVVVTSAYGAVGGTVLGLVSLPFSQDVRTVFMGTSIGLYLGIAVGIFYITSRDDPGNPLTMTEPPPSVGEPIPVLARVDIPVLHF